MVDDRIQITAESELNSGQLQTIWDEQRTGNETSVPSLFAPGPIRSLEWIGPLGPGPIHSLANSFPGTFAPRNEIFRELSLPWT